MTTTPKPIQYNEWDEPSPDEQARREARWNMERSKMHILEHREWPKGATDDEKVYSLECEPAMRSVMLGLSSEQFDLDEDGLIQWAPVSEGRTEFEREKPTLSPVTGSYAQVAVIASKLMRVQEQSGPVLWIYTPALVEPQAVA